MRNELIPLVRLEKLPSDMLIRLSKENPLLYQGREQDIMDALCSKLRLYDQLVSKKYY